MYLINCYQIMKIGHYAIENQPLEVKTGQYPNLEAVATRHSLPIAKSVVKEASDPTPNRRCGEPV
jgi:hypothetical protein